MSELGAGANLNQCPHPKSWGYGKAVASATASATLTAIEPCVEMYFQSSSTNVSAVYIGMNAAASLVQFEIPKGTASAVQAAGTVVQPGWLVLPCPSTTVPTFYSREADQTVYCIWR